MIYAPACNSVVNDKSEKLFDMSNGFTLFSLTGVVAVSLFAPLGTYHLMPHCLFRFVTGIPCPGCGMTRAFLFFGHGYFKEAFLMNPSGSAAFIILVLLWLKSFIYVVTGKNFGIVMGRKTRHLLILVSGCMVCLTWLYNIFLNSNI